MTTPNTTQTTSLSEQGNAKIITLVILALAAIGGGVYYSSQSQGNDGTEATTATATTEEASSQQVAALETESGKETKPAPATTAAEEALEKVNNPVVAKLGDKEIKRVDLLRFTQQLSPQIKQQPFDQLYPYALEQLINNQVIAEKVEGVNLENDPLFQEQMDLVKKNITRTVYMQREVEKRLTDKRVKQEYEEYKKSFPEEEEVKAAHILVDDEALAKKLIQDLNNGADFATLAKENSTDKSSAGNGGTLNFFTKAEVVPEFADAAFKMKEGEMSKAPVKSEFGYHVIKVEEKRKRPPIDFETAKPQIENQLAPTIVTEVLEDWKKGMKIEKFDFDGNAIEPASGK